MSKLSKRILSILTFACVFVLLLASRANTPAAYAADCDGESPDLTGIEPVALPAGVGGTLYVYGNGFVDGDAVRVYGVGVLTTTFINDGILSAVVPASITSGTYSVGVLSKTGCMIKRLYVYDITATPEILPTNTPLPVFAQPSLLLQRGNPNQPTVAPGEFFILSTLVSNLGNRRAVNATVSITSTDILIPIDGSNARVIPSLDPGASQMIEWPVKLGKDVAEGPKSIKFDIRYFTEAGEALTASYEIGLTVLIPKATGSGVSATRTPTPTATISASAQVIMSGFRVDPAGILRPGQQFQLQLQLLNVGNGRSSGLLVSIGGDDGGALKPFAMLNSANVRYVNGIGAQESLDVTFDLMVSGKAESNTYNLPIRISPLEAGSAPSPTDENATPNSTNSAPATSSGSFSAVVSLTVVEEPVLRIGWLGGTAPYLQSGMSMPLSVEIMNSGANQVNISTVEVTSEGMDIQNGSLYVGQLASGTSANVEAVGKPFSDGTVDILVTVNYLDALNTPSKIEKTFTLTVDPAPPTPEVPDNGGETPTPTPAEQPWIVRFFLGLFGINLQ